MLVLGTWFGPALGAALGAIIGGVSIREVARWLRRRSRRDLAIQRIAEWLAWKDSTARGYSDEYDRYLQHYLGGQHWQGKDDDAATGTPGTRRTIRRWRGGQAA